MTLKHRTRKCIVWRYIQLKYIHPVNMFGGGGLLQKKVWCTVICPLAGERGRGWCASVLLEHGIWTGPKNSIYSPKCGDSGWKTKTYFEFYRIWKEIFHSRVYRWIL